MTDHIKFSKELIKGRIAEIVFEQMFRESGNFTILRFGYEYTLPELAQFQHSVELQKVLENMRHTPDFVLISQSKKEVYLVEVKYRSNYYEDEIKQIAEETLKKWDPSFLFLATPKGFFFGPCNTIVTDNGKIGVLYDKWASKEIQEKYLELLNEFERRG
ncbi:MAG: hypothetical protein PHP03_01860 [Candidatus Pacebacteria bacterium]|nr:hypothetical protein [Candidatus Paceibacterota bacterium]